MSTLGVGIVGCGNISSIYLHNIPKFSNLSLRGVSDINAESAKAQAERFSVPMYSVDELLARDDIDIVVNLTTPEVHVSVSRQIVAAKKHVYSEKPLGVDITEARHLMNEAQTNGCYIGCAPDTFMGAAGRLARQLIDNDTVGNILTGTVFIMGHGHEHWHPNPEFYYQNGGGPMLDMGPYYLHSLINLLGPVARVRSVASTGFDTRTATADGPNKGNVLKVETPTTLQAILEFTSGASIIFGASWDVWQHSHPLIELYGSKGSVRVPDPNHFGGNVEVCVGRDDWTEHSSSSMHLGHNNWPLAKPDRANYRALGIAEMADAITQGKPNRSSGQLAFHTLEVMLAIVNGNENGLPTSIESTVERPDVLTENDVPQYNP